MSESKLQIKTSNRGNILVLSVAGSLDALTASQLNQELKARIDSGTSKLICDLSGLEFIASAGVGTLLANLRAAQTAGGNLVLCGLRREVLDVFELLNFSALFKISSDVEAAAHSL